jgi:hypothetical protein
MYLNNFRVYSENSARQNQQFEVPSPCNNRVYTLRLQFFFLNHTNVTQIVFCGTMRFRTRTLRVRKIISILNTSKNVIFTTFNFITYIPQNTRV